MNQNTCKMCNRDIKAEVLVKHIKYLNTLELEDIINLLDL
jgi:hypothetical protein